MKVKILLVVSILLLLETTGLSDTQIVGGGASGMVVKPDCTNVIARGKMCIQSVGEPIPCYGNGSACVPFGSGEPGPPGPAGGVASFNTRTGDIIPQASDYASYYLSSAYTGSTGITTVGVVIGGTWQAQPISNAYIQSASYWNNKENSITPGTITQWYRGDKTFVSLTKADVGLGSVSNAAQVTSVSAASPLSSSGGLTPQISIALANASNSGYLSSTDWNTFNSKLSSNGSGSLLTGITPTQVGLGNVTNDAQVKTTQLVSAASITSPGDDLTVPTTAAMYAAFSVLGGGTVLNVSCANGDCAVTDPTANPIITLNTGTGADQIVKMTGAAKLPAIDGSLLTNMTKAQVGLSNVSNTAQVTSVGASSPLSSTGGLTPSLSIQVANGSQNGYLSSTDWTTFNSKQSAIGYTPENQANKSTNTSLGTSDTLYPSQNAVKSYVDAHAGGSPAFSVLQNGINSQMTATCDTGCNIYPANGGNIQATRVIDRKASGVAGELFLYEASGTSTAGTGFLGTDALTAGSYWLKMPTTYPVVGNVMIFSNPSTSISQASFGGLSSISGSLNLSSQTTGSLPWASMASSPPTWNQSTTGNAATATALAANGTNCATGQAAKGVDASGNAEGCWDVASNVTPTMISSGTGTTFKFDGANAINGLLYTTPTSGTTSTIAAIAKGANYSILQILSDGTYSFTTSPSISAIDLTNGTLIPQVISSLTSSCTVTNALASYSSGTTGQRLYLCESTSGLWKLQGGTGGSGTGSGTVQSGTQYHIPMYSATSTTIGDSGIATDANGYTFTTVKQTGSADYIKLRQANSTDTNGMVIKAPVSRTSTTDIIYQYPSTDPIAQVIQWSAVSNGTTTGSWITPLSTSSTITNQAILTNTIISASTATLTAAQVSSTIISNYGQSGAATLTLPVAACGYSFVAILDTQYNAAWKFQRQGSDTITFTDIGGTISSSKTYVTETNQSVGVMLTCATSVTGAGPTCAKWNCKSGSGTWTTD